jgi:hypothetical protein
MKLAIASLLSLVVACGGNHSTHPDAPPGQTFQCGGMTCALGTQFCFEMVAGRDALAPTPGCNDLPATCATEQTCTCVLANLNITCAGAPTCSSVGNAITVVCPGI